MAAMNRKCIWNKLIYQLAYMIAHVFGIRQYDWTSLNTSTYDLTNQVVYCGPFIVLENSFTHPPLNSCRGRGIGGTILMLQNVCRSGTSTSPVESSCVAWPRKLWWSDWNCVGISHTSWDIRYSYTLLVIDQQYFIPVLPWGQTDSICTRVAWSWQHGNSRWNFVAIQYVIWYICYFLFTSG